MSQPSFDFGVDDEGNRFDEGDGTLTVGELAEAINRAMRGTFRQGIWVRGEIQGWNARGPHAYFTLADDQSESKAVVPVAFFAPQRDRLRPMLTKNRLSLGDGMRVRIFGYLDYYAPTGRLSLKMSGIDPRFTLGDLAMQRDQTMRRLVAEGLLDANKRRRLPAVPMRVGVVTSVGSAAWHDFEHELDRSGIGFELAVCDVRVQGERAVAMVATAIRSLTRRPLDAVVVIRGGGARNELAVFDAEDIARTIAAAPIPVLTGLGHEVDRSVADEVAHTAFKTPTACAQALIATVVEFRQRAERSHAAVLAAAREVVGGADRRLGERAHRIARRTHAAVVRSEEHLRARRGRIAGAAERAVHNAAVGVGRSRQRLAVRAPRLLDDSQRRIDDVETRLRLVDPQRLLERGWTISRRSGGGPLADATPGEGLITLHHGGRIDSTVTAVAAAPDLDPAATAENGPSR